jgi:type I restriction enzyme S subunit
MRRHESYKSSGVKWIGDIPGSWDVSRNIGLFDERKDVNQPEMELLSVTINRGVIKQEEITEKRDSSNEDKSKYKVVRKDDLAYNKMRMWQGAIGRSEYEGIVSPAYVILSPRDNLYSRYYHYLYRTEAFIAEANRHSYGLCLDMNSLRYEDFKTIYSPVPPRPEVESIVAFLDKKTAEINDAIAKKERLIGLLNEQKGILINQAVSLGLNPKATIRASGVKWIGQVPSHWKVIRAKYLFREMDDRSQTGGEELLSVSHITGVTSRSEKTNVYMFMAEDYTGSKLCRPNDLVFNIMWAWMGALGVSEKAGIVSPSYGVYRQHEEGIFNNWYLENLLRSTAYVAEYNRRSTGLHSSRLRLYSHMFFDMELSVPPRDEQDEIEKRTKEHVNRADAVIAATEREIEKLVEFRATLIESYVTGKMRA